MITPRLKIKALKIAFIAAAMALASSTTSFAGPLNIALDPLPEIDARSITSIFNSGQYTATGSAWQWIDDAGGLHTLTQSFKLTATFDTTTGKATSARLILGSDDSKACSASGAYLCAEGLIDFGNTGTQGGTIEFLFGSLGGFNTVFDSTAPLDVTIKMSGTLTPVFTGGGWSNSLETSVLRQPVPEPSSLLLMLAGVVGIYGGRRRILGLHA